MGRIRTGEKRRGENKVTVPHPRSAGSGIRSGERDREPSFLRPLSQGIPNPVPRYLSLWGGRCRDPAPNSPGGRGGDRRGEGGREQAAGRMPGVSWRGLDLPFSPLGVGRCSLFVFADCRRWSSGCLVLFESFWAFCKIQSDRTKRVQAALRLAARRRGPGPRGHCTEPGSV